MKALFAADAVIIVPAGNQGDAHGPGFRPTTGTPAVLESAGFPLIVIGAVNNSGHRTRLRAR